MKTGGKESRAGIPEARMSGRSVLRRVQVDEHTQVEIHVHRDHGRGPWTMADDDALQAVVRAVIRHFSKRRTPFADRSDRPGGQ